MHGWVSAVTLTVTLILHRLFSVGSRNPCQSLWIIFSAAPRVFVPIEHKMRSKRRKARKRCSIDLFEARGEAGIVECLHQKWGDLQHSLPHLTALASSPNQHLLVINTAECCTADSPEHLRTGKQIPLGWRQERRQTQPDSLSGRQTDPDLKGF